MRGLRSMWRVPTMATLVAAGLTAAGSPAAGQAVRAPAEVAVTATVAGEAYQNPSLAVDPTNPARLAVAYFEGADIDRCYLGLSTDAGTTWNTRVLVGRAGEYPGANPATDRCFNPAVAYGPDGTLYYVLQSAIPNDRVPDQVKVYASADGGRSFRGPTVLGVQEANLRAYWPAVAVDPRSGRVHVAWSEHPGPPAPGRVLAASSDDKGATFSAPLAVSPPDQVFPASPQLSVGPDGAVYLVYGSEIDNTLHATTSADGGRTFAAPVLIDDLVPARVFGAGPPVANPLYASFGPRYTAVVAGPRAGTAAMSFWDTRGPGALGRVSIATTSDGGRTWSAPRIVGAPAGREGEHQLNSYLSGAPGGRLDLAYLVRRGFDGPQDTYLTSSDDGGGTFSAPRLLSRASGPSTVGPPGFFGPNTRIGDYVGVASTDAGALVAWTDARRGTADDGAQDILFATTVPASRGYRLVAADGGVFGFGGATFEGSTGALALTQPIVAAAATATGRGYWLAAADGGVFAFGDARFHGSAAALTLRRPIAAMAATPTGRGYWLAGSDGGVFAFGDAVALGAAAGTTLNRPIVAMASSPTGRGYWLAGADGGLFAFGDARYLGSTGALRLNRPVVTMVGTPTGRGYWLVGSDGGVFAFGDAGFFGSTGALRLNRPVVAAAATPTGRGYWLVGSDGGVFAFGDAGFFGSTGALALNRPVVAVAGL